jgi:hypothetical protein
LRRATLARQVILLQEAANFFRDPQRPRVGSFGFPRCPTARCRSPCRFFNAPKDFTETSSLGTSSCTVTDFISSGFASISSGLACVASWPPSHFDHPSFLLARHPSWLSSVPGWRSSFHDGGLTRRSSRLSFMKGSHLGQHLFVVGFLFSSDTSRGSITRFVSTVWRYNFFCSLQSNNSSNPNPLLTPKCHVLGVSVT